MVERVGRRRIAGRPVHRRHPPIDDDDGDTPDLPKESGIPQRESA
jgi:hypothetical protein